MDCHDNGGSDDCDQEIDGLDDSSSADDAVGSGGGPKVSITERLRDVVLGGSDGDLLLKSSYREDGVLQWLHALHMQVMGACCAEERLTPLLKLSTASGGGAEEPLLAHLSHGGS